MELDEKNCKILNLLQKNCRMSLTNISKELDLSVDSVKKRIEKMFRQNIFYPRIQLRPRHFGFPYIVEIRIKLQYYEDDKIKEFIEYLKNHPRVSEIFAFSGDWDYKIVVLAKNHEELEAITRKIRKQFRNIIMDWSESLTTVVYKFEKYNMLNVMEWENE